MHAMQKNELTKIDKKSGPCGREVSSQPVLCEIGYYQDIGSVSTSKLVHTVRISYWGSPFHWHISSTPFRMSGIVVPTIVTLILVIYQ